MAKEAKERLIFKEEEENVPMKSINGAALPSCGTFKYLGTRIAVNGGIAAELQRRVQLAHASMRQMKRMWKSNRVGVRAKKQFFNSLIMAGLLYNCETWVLTPEQKDFLAHAHHKMAKVAMKEPGEPKLIRDGQSSRRETREEFFKRHKMETVEALLTNRRATWLAHAKRNKDDMMNTAFEIAKNKNSAWWEDLGNDLERFDVDQQWILDNADKRALIRDTIRINKRRNVPSDQQSAQAD